MVMPGEMGYQRDGRARTREQRRALRRQDHQAARRQARWRKGQTLIIFALSITMLLGLAGLVIDAARAFDLYARMQRAAEAGALAGVLYMPTYYNAARVPGDGLSAVCRALAEVYKDGFGTNGACPIPSGNPCPSPITTAEIAVCEPAAQPNDIEVFITERLDLTLLGGLGLAPITLTARAQADYLPPVQIGSRQNYFGDQMECTTDNIVFTACAPTDTTQQHVQSFVAESNGPAELKESGDPMVDCAEGPAVLTPPGTDPTSAPAAYNGYSTDHPQWTGVTNGLSGISQYCGPPVPGVNPGNPDYQPAGYDGPMTAGTSHAGGYNYIINVSSATNPATLWIFNPYYIPNDGGTTMDHFIDNGANNFYQGPAKEGISNLYDGSHHDAPLFFFNTTFTLYQVTNLYDRTSDNEVWSQTYQPYDDTSADLTQHSCSSGTVYDPYWSGANTPNTYYKPSGIPAGSGCVAPPTCEPVLSATLTRYSTWCEALQGGTTPVSLTPGNVYRLVEEVTGLSAKTPAYNSGLQDGWGGHSYALKLCSGLPTTAVNCNGGGTPGSFTNANLTIFGWNNADVTFQQQLGSAAPNPNVPAKSCVSTVTLLYGCMDFGCIPSAFAGRTLTAALYDPGDGAGDLYMGIVPPPGAGSTATISYPSYATVFSGSAYDGDTVVQTHFGSTGYRPFNGLWLDVTIQLSASYVGSCATGGTTSQSGWFQVVYMSGNGNPSDVLALQFTLVGSPVHLILPL